MWRPRWIALGCAIVACAIHVEAVQNQFAMDDVPIVRDNPAAHSVPSALNAWLESYWPPDSGGASAGQYRPFTILSFAADWSVSGGAPGWLHADNVILHGVVTALVVLVLSVWLSRWGLWVTGLLFAVHPVHVEAVAGLVGRAELLAAAALLGAVLASRRFREAAGSWARFRWLVTIAVLALIGLFSKEHAVVVIALVAVDHALTDRSNLRRNAVLYVTLAAVTFAWLHLFQGVAGEYVEGSRAALFRGLSNAERVATMLPVQLDVVRLLAWPFDLASDYNPQMIVQRTALSWTGLLGGLVAVSVLGLGIATLRRAPAIAFGILSGVMTYAPTSNLVFASGVALAERNLYLAVLAPAAAVGWLVSRTSEQRIRRWLLVGVGAVTAAFAARTMERVRAWEDTRTIVIEDIIEHPENYRTRLRLASYFVTTGDAAAALAEYMVAVALFPRDPFIATRSVPRALELGLSDLAIQEARRAHDLLPGHPILAELLVDSYLAGGWPDSVLEVARRAIVKAPRSVVAIRSYSRVLARIDAPRWVRTMNQARLHSVNGRYGRATTVLAAAFRSLREQGVGQLGTDCWDIRQGRMLAGVLELRLSDTYPEEGMAACEVL